jgi:hypothetical protein
MGYLLLYTIIVTVMMMTVLVIGTSRLAWRRWIVWLEASEGYDESNVTMVRLFSFHMLEY